jgi:hypothetical protein
MTVEHRVVLKWTGAAVLLAAAVVIGITQMGRVTTTGEEGVQVWFYDQSARQLYAVPRDTLPPHAGIDGKPDDGVRAIVVAAESEQRDPTKLRIAYLETYTPELKRILEEMRAARAGGRPARSALPGSDGDYFQQNTLVCRPGETTWYAQTSKEGPRIMAEWHGWTSAAGQPLVVCVP